MTTKAKDGRGRQPGSRAALMAHRQDLPASHGWHSKSIQTVGIPVRKSCPLRLLGGCDCDTPDEERCPPMIQVFTDRVTELQEEGITRKAAEHITRLEFQSSLGHYAMDLQGAVMPSDDNGGTFRSHPLWKGVGVVDHALERFYKAAGLLRVGNPPSRTEGILEAILEALQDFPEARTRVAEALISDAEVEKGGDDAAP